MTVLQEARDYLEKMKEHTECCGVPIVRKMVAELQRMESGVDEGTGCVWCDVGSICTSKNHYTARGMFPCTAKR